MKKYLEENKKLGMIGVFALGGLVLAVFLVFGFGKVIKADLYSGTNIHPSNNPIYQTLTPPQDYSTSTYHWAWNDVIGWVDFHSSSTQDIDHNINVYSKYLDGWASSAVGEIVLNCQKVPPSGDPDCTDPSVGEWGVKNDGSGFLSGLAWNDTIGWIVFCGAGSSTVCDEYKLFSVRLDQPWSVGDDDAPPSYFHEYAWNDVIGWISFNCFDYGICLTSDYKVATDWFATSTYGILDSAIIDTGEVKGAQINSIIWKGNLPYGTGVSFQLAVATSTAALLATSTFLGPGGLQTTFYNTIYPSSALDSPGVYRVNIDNISDFTNKRYFRYRVRLKSNSTQLLTPRVDEVLVNWSP